MMHKYCGVKNVGRGADNKGQKYQILHLGLAFGVELGSWWIFE
jgi:hypothetical protein